MKKLILLAAAVVLLVAAPAPAKTVTVDISKAGFVPAIVPLTRATAEASTFIPRDASSETSRSALPPLSHSCSA